jgi:two-component system, NtrC family, nitrogen regulation sensor histidine kinase NtrY
MATEASLPVTQRQSLPIQVASAFITAFENGRSMRLLEIGSAILLVLFAGLTAAIFVSQGPLSEPLSPAASAGLLVGNLLPATFLLVLFGRRMALKRAERSNIASKELLHVRLVAIFSAITAVPTLLLVVFASLLFQSGVQFWFSSSARGMLENAGELAKGYNQNNSRDVGDETRAMTGDLRNALRQTKPNDPVFLNYYIDQIVRRRLSESAIVSVGADNSQLTEAVYTFEENRRGDWISPDLMQRLTAGEEVVTKIGPRGIEAAALLFDQPRSYVYTRREVTVPAFALGDKANAVLSDYKKLEARSRALQLQFSIALYLGSLLIIAITLWIALRVADRLVRPINSLVDMAEKIANGDLSARVVENQYRPDEVGFLAQSFNHMTDRLQSQTGNLLAANRQLDDRRTFIETILESVSAAVLSTNSDGTIRLANGIAEQLLNQKPGALIDAPLQQAAPFLSELVEQGRQQAIVQLGDGAEPQTLAVKITALENGHVVTFEDITQQLTDQRQAAWADVARRIAHEIKNPLTPIQLAAERLQRRFGKQIEEGAGIFAQLTGTIVRQVGDLRNIVDEFSSFARMPKPVFRDESLNDIVGHSVFLFEVAHSNISFDYVPPDKAVLMRCDRRQVGQAVTNILKNAAEAIEARIDAGTAEPTGKIGVEIKADAAEIRIIIRDNGIGLPDATERLVEPYVTTRSNGSGLGLAIVKKIVEEHHGELLFSPNDPGGAQVIMKFYPERMVVAPAHSAAPSPKLKKNKD